jgi:hypothetical protein
MPREAKYRPLSIVALLGDASGQSWVETVVMLPVIVAILLGLFYLHDLPAARMRATQAARFVAWESTWYAREDNPNRAMKTPDQLQARLKKVGLGFGLKKVEVIKRDIRKYKSDQIGGVDSELFVPCAIANLFGGACGTVGKDQSKSFVDGIAKGFSGVLDGLAGLAGPLAFGMQDLMADNLNWNDEMNGSVYTSVVRYRVGYTGFFASFGTSNIVQTASVLSHPYTLRRTDDDKEYEELLGDPCKNLFGSDQGHVVGLWLIPAQPIPIQGGGTSADAAAGAVKKLTSGAKCVASAIGGLGKMLDSALGTSLGFKMPDGTLKEYPELSMPTKSGVSSGDGSGGSLGKRCGEGGGGAMGVGDGCS